MLEIYTFLLNLFCSSASIPALLRKIEKFFQFYQNFRFPEKLLIYTATVLNPHIIEMINLPPSVPFSPRCLCMSSVVSVIRESVVVRDKRGEERRVTPRSQSAVVPLVSSKKYGGLEGGRAG